LHSKIEATAVLASYLLMLGTGNLVNNNILKQVETPIHYAVASSYKNEFEVKAKEIHRNKDSKFVFPKISLELENQIKKQIKDIEIQENKQKQIQYDKDLYLLGQVIEAESGSDWIKDEVQLMVGNVVMNRVSNDKFPNTIYDVVHAPNQYQFIKHGITVRPSKRALDNARKILNGTRVIPKNVVYQSEYKNLGDGIYKKVKTKYSTMYFSYSK